MLKSWVRMVLLCIFVSCPTVTQAVTTTAMGVIWDVSNNTCCAHAWIWCDNQGNSAYANDEGLYIIENFNLSSFATTAYFAVTKTGYAEFKVYLPIVPGEVNTITAYIQKGGLISGIVTSHEVGSPAVAGATVTALSGVQVSNSFTQADGSYQIRMPTGTTKLYVEHQNCAASLKTVLAVIDQTMYPNTDFQLYVGGTVSGVVYYGETTATVANHGVNYERSDGDAWPGGSTTTANDGSYTLTHVYPDSIDINTTGVGQWSDVQRAYVPVIDGQVTAEIDLRLVPAGSMCGTITAYTSAPVAGVKVILTQTGSASSKNWNVNTDSNGFYAHEDIPEGRYDVAVIPPQGLNLQIIRVNNVSVVHPNATTLEFALQAGGLLAGYVHGVAGNTLAAAKLSLYLDGQYPFEELFRKNTNSSGYYEFDGLSPYQNYTLSVDTSTSNTINASMVRRGLAFNENETSELDFNLSLGGTLKGKLYSYLSQPNEAVFLSYFMNADQAFVRLIWGADYELFGLPANNYFVYHYPAAGSLEYAPYTGVVKITSEQVNAQDYTLAKSAGISGFVYLEEGGGNTAPAAGVMLQVKNARGLLASFAGSFSHAETDGGGYYEINNLTNGAFDIYVYANVEDGGGYAAMSRAIVLNPDSSSQENFILQKPGVKIGGVVRDQNGNRVGNSMVCFWNQSGDKIIANADKWGCYSVMLTPGIYTYQGYLTSLLGSNFAAERTTGLVVQSDGTYEEDVIMETGGVVSGIIKDQLGQGVDLAQIIIYVENNPTPVRFGLTDDSGGYSICGLHSATYQMEVQAAGYSSDSREFTATLGEETEAVNMIIIAQTTIAGLVRAKGNRVPEEMLVSILDSANNNILLQTEPNSQGEYILSPVSGGPYSVKATALGMKAGTRRDVYAGDRADFTLEPLIGKEEAISYPNPCRGNAITFLYWVEEAATILIRVYNQTGELVWDWEGPGTERQYNRKQWNVTGVAPGVYLFKITNRNQHGSISRFLTGKLTVIK